MAERLPAEVVDALRAGGWTPEAPDPQRASDWGLQLCVSPSPAGLRHTFFPAAERALAEFGGVSATPSGTGAQVRASGFTVDPTLVAATWMTLAQFAEVLGAALFPLGEEHETGAVLAVDENGRVFALDHTGEWFLGTSAAQAWRTLLLGHRPRRVSDDGTWA